MLSDDSLRNFLCVKVIEGLSSSAYFIFQFHRARIIESRCNKSYKEKSFSHESVIGWFTLRTFGELIYSKYKLWYLRRLSVLVILNLILFLCSLASFWDATLWLALYSKFRYADTTSHNSQVIYKAESSKHQQPHCYVV